METFLNRLETNVDLIMLWPNWLGLRPGSMAQRGGGMDGQMDVQTDGKSPHSTELRPLSGPLPKKSILLLIFLITNLKLDDTDTPTN